MGYRAGVLSTTDDAPAAQVAHWTVIGPPDHLPALHAFADRAEAVTVEFENVSAPALRWLARRRIVRPGWRTRLDQPEPAPRENASWPGTSYPSCALAAGPRRARACTRRSRPSGLPLILKTAASGYDGKGQVLVNRQPTLAAPGPAWAGLPAWPRAGSSSPPRSRSSWPAARMAAPSAYPVGLNRHERHILDSTMMPAPVGPVVALEARDAGPGRGPGAGDRGRL